MTLYFDRVILFLKFLIKAEMSFSVDKNKISFISEVVFVVATLQTCFAVDNEKCQCVGFYKTSLI